MKYEYKHCGLPFEIKDVDGRKGIVCGYFSAFGNVDAHGDIIKQGAFTKTINERGPLSTKPRIKHLLNHDPTKPVGVIQSLKEDAKGLYYESKVGVHSLGKDFILMAESGLVTEHSIGFEIVKRDEIQSWNNYEKNPAKGLWTITEIKLWEGSSLTAWGANEDTPLQGMKSLEQMEARQKALEAFCRNSEATDETIEALLLEVKQLTSLVISVREKASEPTITHPEKDEWSEHINILKQLNNSINGK